MKINSYNPSKKLKPINKKPGKVKKTHMSVAEALKNRKCIMNNDDVFFKELQAMSQAKINQFSNQEKHDINKKLLRMYKERTENNENTSEVISELIRLNQTLVIHIVRRYSHPGSRENDFDDLMQEGILGLMIAIERFDESFGAEFSTYAVPWIEQKIKRYCSNNDGAIRLPVHVREILYKAYQLQREAEVEHKTISTREITAIVYKKQIEQSIKTLYGERPRNKKQAYEKVLSDYENKLKYYMDMDKDIVCLDTPIGTDPNDADTLLGDLIPDQNKTPEEKAFEHMRSERLEQILDSRFDKRTRDILRLRFGFEGRPMTLEAVAQKYHLTRERIRQIEANALRKMQKKPSLKRELLALCYDIPISNTAPTT